MSSGRAVIEVLELLSREKNGILSTLSQRHAGWPFGSLTPYVPGPFNEPVILISEIAEHTRNVRSDARVSLLVQDTRSLEDPQSGARATLMGFAMPVPEPCLESSAALYRERFPLSTSFLEAHDFTLFRIVVSRIRYIGGFGDIHWLEDPDLTVTGPSPDPLGPHRRAIRDHMNEDHADALILYARTFGGRTGDSARMIHVDSAGFDLIVQSDGAHGHLRIEFPERVTTTNDARRVLVDMVRRARGGRSQPRGPDGEN